MHFVKIKHASVSVSGAEACSILAEFIAQTEPLDLPPSCVDLELSQSEQGIQLIWNKGGGKPFKYHLNFEKLAKQLRSFPAPKQGAFNQALGKKTKHVIDATGGWGGDAMLMCLQGYEVTVIERLPLMASLLKDAFSRLSRTSWAIDNDVKIPTVVCGDAIQELTKLSGLGGACVYLDPMFPSKKKRKAAVNKQMQLLQWLAGADDDARDVAVVAMVNYSRLAVKRPDHALPLIGQPNVQFSSKLVHYDVYLSN